MQHTDDQKTTGATDLASDGLFLFQATEKPPLFAPPHGGSRGPQALFPDRPVSRSLRSPVKQTDETLTEETLTEIDRIATFATQLDAILASIGKEATRTVAIHVFVRLTGNDHDYNVDISELATETSLSVRQVKRSLYHLVLTGKIRRLHGKKPRRYRLLLNRGGIV